MTVKETLKTLSCNFQEGILEAIREGNYQFSEKGIVGICHKTHNYKVPEKSLIDKGELPRKVKKNFKYTKLIVSILENTAERFVFEISAGV